MAIVRNALHNPAAAALEALTTDRSSRENVGASRTNHFAAGAGNMNFPVGMSKRSFNQFKQYHAASQQYAMDRFQAAAAHEKDLHNMDTERALKLQAADHANLRALGQQNIEQEAQRHAHNTEMVKQLSSLGGGISAKMDHQGGFQFSNTSTGGDKLTTKSPASAAKETVGSVGSVSVPKVAGATQSASNKAARANATPRSRVDAAQAGAEDVHRMSNQPSTVAKTGPAVVPHVTSGRTTDKGVTAFDRQKSALGKVNRGRTAGRPANAQSLTSKARQGAKPARAIMPAIKPHI